MFSIANAGLLGAMAQETDKAKIDSVFPKLISNTEQCLTECSATFTYCLDGTNDIELSFNIPEVTSYGYYTDKIRTEEYQTGKCLKEQQKEVIVWDNKTSKNTTINETYCTEQEIAEKDTSYQEWNNGLPSKEKGCYNVTIYGHKKPFENVDWIPTLKIKGFLWDTEYTKDDWAWWNGAWLNCKNITIYANAGGDMNYTEHTLEANLTGLTFSSTNEIRTVNASCGNGGTEIPRDIYQNGTDWADVFFNFNKTAGANQTYSVYYNNPSATAPSYTSVFTTANTSYVNVTGKYSAVKTSVTAPSTTAEAMVLWNSTDKLNSAGSWGTMFFDTAYVFDANVWTRTQIFSGNVVYIFSANLSTRNLTYKFYKNYFDTEVANTGAKPMSYTPDFQLPCGATIKATENISDAYATYTSADNHLVQSERWVSAYCNASGSTQGIMGKDLNVSATNNNRLYFGSGYTPYIQIGSDYNPVTSPFVTGSTARTVIMPKDSTQTGDAQYYIPIQQEYYKFVNGVNFTTGAEESPISMTWDSQSPLDITNINIFGSTANMTYNITNSSYVNPDQTWIYYKTNSTASNTAYYVNGTAYAGFFNQTPSAIAHPQYTFRLGDNKVYPATYNINETTMESTAHSSMSILIASDLAKIELLNVSNATQYGQFEIMANSSATATSLLLYYCNSSYSTGDPTSSSSCAMFGSIPANNPYNHTHPSGYSSHQLVPFAINTTSGQVNGIEVTSTSYFIAQTTGAVAWNLWYISDVSRTSAFQTSATMGTSWSNVSGTLDSHLHQYNGTNNLTYYACYNDTGGSGLICETSNHTDNLDLTPLPPNAPDVYSPTGNNYTGNVNINYTASTTPIGYLTSYNISLVYTNETVAISIANNTNTTLGYIWNSSTVASGNYKIRVRAFNNYSLYSDGFSETISVDNSAPTTTATAVDYNGTNYIFGTVSQLNLTLTLSCNDSSGIGCNVTRYCIDSANSCTPNTTYSSSFDYATSGTHYLRYRSNDSLNNTETTKNSTMILNLYLPVVADTHINSTTNLTNANILGFCNGTDEDNDTLIYYWEWYLNNSLNDNGYASNGYTYQENATSYAPTNDLSPESYDANYSTYSTVTITYPSPDTLNYTKPTGSGNGALWQMKVRITNANGTSDDFVNVSIPQDCFDYSNDLQLQINKQSSFCGIPPCSAPTGNIIDFNCNNGTWKNVKEYSRTVYNATYNDDVIIHLYEEAIFWEKGFPQGIKQNIVNNTSALSTGDTWLLSCLANDGLRNSSWANSTALTIGLNYTYSTFNTTYTEKAVVPFWINFSLNIPTNVRVDVQEGTSSTSLTKNGSYWYGNVTLPFVSFNGNHTYTISWDVPSGSSSVTNNISINGLVFNTTGPGDVALNISFFDEKTLANINTGTTLETVFTILYPDNTSKELGFNTTGNTKFYLTPGQNISATAQMLFYKANYNQRTNYIGYLAPFYLTNNTQQLKLYMIQNTTSSPITWTVTDWNDAKLVGAYFIMQRFYVSNNTWNTISISRTDNNGQTTIYLEPYTAFYRVLIVNTAGQLVFSGLDTVVSFSTNSIKLSQYLVNSTFNDVVDSLVSTTFNNTTRILTSTVLFNGATRTAYMNVYQQNMLSDTLICNRTGSGSTVAMSCTLPANNTKGYRAEIKADYNGTNYTIGSYTVSDSSTRYGTDGIVAVLMIVMSLSFFMMRTPELVIIGNLMGLMICFAIGIFNVGILSTSTMIGLIFAGIMVMVALRK